MTQLEELLLTTEAELARVGLPWALVGGLAVSVRAEPRFTRDIDVAIAVADDLTAETIVVNLRQRGLVLLESLEQEATGRLATVRLGLSKGELGAVLDILFASSGIEPEIVEQAEVLEIIPRLRVPVARTGHLIALKVLSRDDATRPQDSADLHALLSEALAEDLTLARLSLRLISERGYHRGRELEGDLERFLRGRE